MVYKSTTRTGKRFEYLVASVFQSQGYLVRTGVPLKYGPRQDDMTDIDVLGIKFTQPFQPHRIICDCKDKQKSKPYERIFWAKGLGSFVRASEVYVFQPKSSLEITNFAKSGQVRILTPNILRNSLQKISGSNPFGYGWANASFIESFYREITPIIKKEKDASYMFLQARTLYLVEDPYISISLALDYLKTSADMLSKINDTSKEVGFLWKFISAELVVMVSILLLYITSDTIGLAKPERAKYILERLTYGDVSPKKAKEIFGLAKELAIETAKSILPDASMQAFLPFDIGQIESPNYGPDVVGLVERAITSPLLYHDLPQIVDFLLFEQSLQGKDFSYEDYGKTFPSLVKDERLKVARNIFTFVRDATGLNLKIFWPKQENNLPKQSRIIQ